MLKGKEVFLKNYKWYLTSLLSTHMTEIMFWQFPTFLQVVLKKQAVVHFALTIGMLEEYQLIE